jgi:hypothetical protein
VTDPTFTPVPERELLAVYPDAEHAHDARGALVAAGVPESAIRVGGEVDTVAALRAEQHDELSRAWVVPNAAAVYPGTSVRAMNIIGVVGAAVAIPLGLLLALYDFGPSYWLRAVILVGVGLALAFTIAIVAGPPSAAERPAEVPDAAGGVTLRVAADSDELREVLVRHEPVRLVEVTSDGTPIDTLVRERPDTTSETVKDMAANAEGDDYHPER